MTNDGQVGGTYRAIEQDGVTEFSFGESEVTQIRVDHRLTLLLAGGAAVVIGVPCTMMRDGAPEPLHVGEPRLLSPALDLFGRGITRIDVLETGRLHVHCGTGWSIEVPVDPSYENWELLVPDGDQSIGLPGGGIS